MLKTENISFRIGEKILVDKTSLSFEQHRFHVIMGANGAGKSTLLKLLAGSQHPSGGKIFLDEKELKHFTKKELATHRAVLSQHYNITFPITTTDIVLMGRYPHYYTTPSHHDLDICRQVMLLMKIEDLADRDYNTLSGGEAQKAQMSRVLAQIWEANKGEEKILFLDEPVSHLDLKYQNQLLQVAKNLCKQNVTVIAILHDINLALGFADRILFMKQGAIRFETGDANAVTPLIIREIFDVEANIFYPENGQLPIVSIKRS